MTRALKIFEVAVALDVDARAAFLEQACGDDAALRAELDSLLAAHDSAGAFLREPTLADAATIMDRPGDVEPPATTGARMIGRYKLLQKIGEGGFGTVWMAEQREPVRRRVALKIIKPGMDSRQVIARFEAERQALAMMEHPNIARVLDGGTTAGGHPYFVMEYINGVPILAYCDTEKLDTRARLGLFVQACHAIQHAHQKGIVHRDVKPSNVMVTLHDGMPVVKVIDFGIAKATNAELTTRTLFTAHGQIIGTPAYMSPEQAEMSGLDIDTRSDIYSLGVLLYELLTGTTPFTNEELLSRGYAEMMRIIREQEPHKPSARLSSLGASATSAADARHVDVARLSLLVRGDLDWIVMTCLEKDRTRRYETASGLAADIARHLADEPVTAGPPTARYRLGKFIRRHRAGVVAATTLAAVLVLGAVGTTIGLLRAQAAEADSQLAQAEASAAADLARALQPQADEYRARVLLEQAETLWPPLPDPTMLASLEQWSVAARELTASLPEYRHRLALMRERAASGGPLETATAEGAAGSREWRFESTHELLSRLVTELELLGDGAHGLLADDAVVPGYGWSVPKRLSFARAMATGFAEGGEFAAAWARVPHDLRSARADLDADGVREEAYPGLELAPQIGLLPLGPDPDSGLLEFAHLMSGEPAVRDENDRLVLTEDTGLILVLIPGGTFWMGAETRAAAPRHQVTLSPYFVSKWEMTQGQWQRLTGENPSAYGPHGEWDDTWLSSGEPPSLLHPVEQVSWRDCNRWLARAGLALPSEAQWERAARAGTQTVFSTGERSEGGSFVDPLRGGAANVRDASFSRAGIETWGNHDKDLDDGSVVHWPIDHRPRVPNRFGLHDVHGNVWEWCLDSYAPYREPGLVPEVDPVVAATDDARYVSRGGGFRHMAWRATSATREFDPPDHSGSAKGVRPARAITNPMP